MKILNFGKEEVRRGLFSSPTSHQWESFQGIEHYESKVSTILSFLNPLYDTELDKPDGVATGIRYFIKIALLYIPYLVFWPFYLTEKPIREVVTFINEQIGALNAMAVLFSASNQIK